MATPPAAIRAGYETRPVSAIADANVTTLIGNNCAVHVRDRPDQGLCGHLSWVLVTSMFTPLSVTARREST